MESNKNLTGQGTPGGSTNKTTTGTTGVGGSTLGSSVTGGSTGSNLGGSSPTTNPVGGQGTTSTASAPQRAREQGDTGGNGGTMQGAMQTVSDAYGRTTEVLSNTYDQAMSYGRENPGKLTLIAFGAGIGIGLLLSGLGGRSRTSRIAEPVVNALSQVALEFFK